MLGNFCFEDQRIISKEQNPEIESAATNGGQEESASLGLRLGQHSQLLTRLSLISNYKLYKSISLKILLAMPSPITLNIWKDINKYDRIFISNWSTGRILLLQLHTPCRVFFQWDHISANHSYFNKMCDLKRWTFYANATIESHIYFTSNIV